MLIDAKPKLEKDLYKAFYDAYMSQYSKNKLTPISDSQIKKEFEKVADKFAKDLSSKMSDAIYDFVKEIGIEVTIPPTVISPSGPCTGAIPQTNFKIS